MKKGVYILLILALILGLVGCAPTDSPVGTSSTISQITANTSSNTASLAIGGDAGRWFTDRYQFKVTNISDYWWDFTDEEARENWRKDYYARKDAGEKMVYPYLIDFIKEMGLSKELCKKVVDKMHQDPNWEENHLLDYSDLDIIFTFDPVIINQTFVGSLAVYANGEIYNMEWILNHSAADYMAAGITAAQIEEKLPTYAQFLGTEHQDYTQLYTQKLNDLKALEK